MEKHGACHNIFAALVFGKPGFAKRAIFGNFEAQMWRQDTERSEGHETIGTRRDARFLRVIGCSNPGAGTSQMSTDGNCKVDGMLCDLAGCKSTTSKIEQEGFPRTQLGTLFLVSPTLGRQVEELRKEMTRAGALELNASHRKKSTQSI